MKVAELSALAVQVVRGRWFTVFASFLVMAASGGIYIFGIYSNDIKTALGYDQQTLNTLAFFKDLGASVGIISGLIYEVTPPWVVLALSAGINLFSYLMIYLAITGRIARPHVWQMCLYLCLGGNAQAFTNTGAVVTCVKNFPASRGVVIGLLKGYVGLSGAIVTQLYLAFYGGDSRSLVLLIAWLPAAIPLVFISTIRIFKSTRQPGESSKPFYCFLYVSLFLATFLMVMIVVQKRFTFSHSAYSVSAAIVLLLLFLPLAVVTKEEFKIFRKKKQSLQDPPPLSVAIETPTVPQPPPPEPKPTPATASPIKKSSPLSHVIRIFKAPDRGKDYSILQAVVSTDMLILFLSTISGVGGTLAAIDNMGQIGQSLGYPARSISTFVSLISIWNYAGRVAAGFASDIFLAKYKLPRPVLLAAVLLLAGAGHLLIAFGIPGSLYVASVIIGFSLGAQVPLLFAIISEVFGLKYYSTLFNFVPLATPIGTYVLNVKVAGKLYDREAAKQYAKLSGSSVKSLTCTGVQCFKLSFLIIAAVTVLGALVMLVLVWRTWDFYKGDMHEKYREESQGRTHGEERKNEMIPYTPEERANGT
ncbi:uncharacterized protein LOC120113377 isoform X2 [Phoenix dactylifera]|uniref:Uncharacterized protein LOC120113377 isoform X1 n=1 Tax=Phoenix dactylifera TaxID=42345 RepID=A0A8B9AXW0_PHODC|nr:uncharacterized protein LOC120113377 isoform X1 [Phoenix dactylifera]XP_038990467.1 uncharacterized protein LOC120113377 isoform X2 [Phoenix dactylifera]